MFAQRRRRLTTHFSEHNPVVKWRMTVLRPQSHLLYGEDKAAVRPLN